MNNKTIFVFVNKNHKYGNPVKVILDEKKLISEKEKISLVKKSNFSEVVFIDNIKNRKISIYNQQEEIDFAGHSLLGAIFEISRLLNKKINFINCKAGKIKCDIKNNFVSLEAPSKFLPKWNLIEYSSPEKINNIRIQDTKNIKHT